MKIYWKFTNEHVWNHTIASIDDAYCFAYVTGFTTHPDIVSIWVVDGDKQTIIFRKTA